MSTVGSRLKSVRRRRRLFSLAVVSRPGKKQHPQCTLCLCGKSSIRLPQAATTRSRVYSRFSIWASWQGELEVFPCSKLYIPGKSIILEASSVDDKDYHKCGTLPGCRCLVQVSASTDRQLYGLYLHSTIERKTQVARKDAHICGGSRSTIKHPGQKANLERS
jgi:hypothetical protein